MRQRQERSDAAHFLRVLFVVHTDDDGPGTKEQECLEKGVGEQMEHRRAIGTNTGRKEHITELRTGGVGNDFLDVILEQANGRCEKRRY